MGLFLKQLVVDEAFMERDDENIIANIPKWCGSSYWYRSIGSFMVERTCVKYGR